MTGAEVFPHGPAGAWLGAAAAIGRQMCSEAVWYEDRCTWVGAENEEGASGQVLLSHRALGPDLYGGTSGVALFLANLYCAVLDPDVRRTALGAIRHALTHIEDISPDGWAVYTGRSGVLMAAAIVGRATGEDELLDRVHRGVADARPGPPEHFDIISGHAGAVLGLLCLSSLLGNSGLTESAVRFADALLGGATRVGEELSWAPPQSPRSPHLAGYSHGAAGAARALLEIHVATGEAAYRDAAEGAFAYERRLFDPRRKNWPDLRGVARPGGQAPGAGPGWATYWCHGAPGVALSRLRAVELLADGPCRLEAVAAAETTSRMVVSWLAAGANYSLCHGLTGNVEMLLYADDVLGTDNGHQLAGEVAERGVERFSNRGRHWPCGTIEGGTPNLLLGTAGIGLFYLRLRDPSIPSVLLLRPETYRSLIPT